MAGDPGLTDEQIRAAWERFHGPVEDLDGYIPATPPTYVRGYDDGAESIADEVRSVIAILEKHDAHWSDESMIRSVLIRLRKLVTP